jgi:glutaredoxin-like protein NrdH
MGTHYAVTVYTTGPGCQGCRLTALALAREGIAYREVDLRTDPAAAAVVSGLHAERAPVVVVEGGAGEHHWWGFRPDLITRLAASIAAGSESDRIGYFPSRGGAMRL